MRNSLSHKNSPRLGGLLLDVIPRQLKDQPLDICNIAKTSYKVNNGSMAFAQKKDTARYSKTARHDLVGQV